MDIFHKEIYYVESLEKGRHKRIQCKLQKRSTFRVKVDTKYTKKQDAKVVSWHKNQ